MLAKIKGFRNFLETAEKDRIALIVKQDPSYFYDILPYAYALEVSKVWMDDFKTIGFEKPNWFDDNRPFSPSNFNDSMDQTMRSANDAMTSEPISDSSPFDGHDSGSSFSSSGSSGGGSGGGGGGSW